MLLATESNNYYLRSLDPNKDDLRNYISWMTNTTANIFIQGARMHYSIEELKYYISEKNNSSDAILFGIFSKKNGCHIGNVKLEPIVKEDYAWIGTLIGDPAQRGLGVGFEVISHLIEYSKDVLHLQYICLGVNISNTPALKLYKKLGFIEFIDNTAQANGIQMKYNLI